MTLLLSWYRPIEPVDHYHVSPLQGPELRTSRFAHSSTKTRYKDSLLIFDSLACLNTRAFLSWQFFFKTFNRSSLPPLLLPRFPSLELTTLRHYPSSRLANLALRANPQRVKPISEAWPYRAFIELAQPLVRKRREPSIPQSSSASLDLFQHPPYINLEALMGSAQEAAAIVDIPTRAVRSNYKRQTLERKSSNVGEKSKVGLIRHRPSKKL
ncbi:hypothetical protein PVK06_020160 [Gossypium arboreum]|uniref:Uncharacterized protein n=1 Tax=Gossypium arboreum TaxID=29729 RepID=A0ABR0PLN9_GOSAR|nr:hypothetical protein PVK06_020160 [Gossypium arboreum]